MGKEDFRGMPVCNDLNKTMPLIQPIGAVAAATFFMPWHTGERDMTRVLPAQSTTQGLPEPRIKERLFHRDQKRGVVIVSRPSGELPARSPIVGLHPVRPIKVIASFDGFLECLCDGHGWAPLAGEGHGATVSHIEQVSQDDSVGA